jgi:hypothetical protein
VRKVRWKEVGVRRSAPWRRTVAGVEDVVGEAVWEAVEDGDWGTGRHIEREGGSVVMEDG